MSVDGELLPAEPYATATKTGGRRWVYPRRVPGRWLNARRIVAWGLIIVYTSLPHLTINGMPAILLDIQHRRFTLFGTRFWPTDTLLLALFLIGFIVTIVALTAVFGRIWCGWGCPQTVYLEFLFRPIENLIEGKGFRQKKFDASPPTASKIARKLLKWFIFLIISMILAHTFLAYFVGVDRLEDWMTRSPLEHPFSFLLMIGVTGAMLFDFLWFREQMCTLACPYGRLQSVMLDAGSLIIGYDRRRGEPRGKLRKKGASADGERGDCVDCGLCVQVCPTGIDIRNGLQLECIACAQCIDACDSVMEKIGRPKGLIRYASKQSLEGETWRFFRPRLLGYALLLVMIGGGLAYGLASRSLTTVNVLRAAEEPYQELPDGRISNHLRVRISNRASTAHTYRVSLRTPAEATLTLPVQSLTVQGGEIGTLDAFIALPRNALHSGTRMLRFDIISDDGQRVEAGSPFVGPE